MTNDLDYILENEMTRDKILQLLNQRERINLEFKESAFAIPENVYETVSAFSNRFGGYIILGVDDSGKAKGINPNKIGDMKRNFTAQLNNTNKMSPTLYLPIEEFEIEGKLILACYVPSSSTVVRCSGRVYDRNEDGDLDITDSPIQMENLYARKIGVFNEHKIFPYVGDEDLRFDLFPMVRRLILNRNPEHPWLKMSDKEILISAGLYEKDYSSGKRGYNLAAVMLFGKDEVIRSCVPGYVTDALLRVDEGYRYDDRLRVSTNLIESYDALMAFARRNTPDKFYLEGDQNVSIRDIIVREIVANILVHRDFSSSYPARIVITKDWLKAENWCRPRRHGDYLEDEFSPYPKNPLVASFFTTLGRSETIGSGVRNLYRLVPVYSGGGRAVLFEDDVFRTEVPLSSAAVIEQKENNTLTEREQSILELLKMDRRRTTGELALALGVNKRTILRSLGEMRRKISLSYDRKDGTWHFE